MSTTKHTPGPWVISEDDAYTLAVVAPWSNEVKPATSVGSGDYRGIHVAKISHQNDNPCVSKDKALANAALIAAAPELLEALKRANYWIAKQYGTILPVDAQTVYEFARNAIDKAEGRS